MTGSPFGWLGVVSGGGVDDPGSVGGVGVDDGGGDDTGHLVGVLGVGAVDDGPDAAGAGVDSDASFGLIVDLAVPGVNRENGGVVSAGGETVLDELAVNSISQSSSGAVMITSTS